MHSLKTESAISSYLRKGEPFRYRNVVAELKSESIALLPGLTSWIEKLSPQRNADAWKKLHIPQVQELLKNAPRQQEHYFLEDSGSICERPHCGVTFEGKTEKSHLTVVEPIFGLVDYSSVPECVADYLGRCHDFLNHVSMYFSHILPRIGLPSILKMRIFEYHASDPLVGFKLNDSSITAMKSHVDGSIVTLIIAESDGCLECLVEGVWREVTCEGGQPFACLIPGICAKYAFGVKPLPHRVRPGGGNRISITVFLTPELGVLTDELGVDSKAVAERRLQAWRRQRKR